MSDLNYEEPKASKLPIIALTLRVTTLVTLAISIGVLRSDSVTFDLNSTRGTFNFKTVQTYQYVFFGVVVGLFYTLFHIPFALYFFFRKKRLINNTGFLMFEYYGEKVCMILLALSLGALFGATVQTNDGAQAQHDRYGDYYTEVYRSKMREYCMLAYVSAIFLLIGCCCSITSSFISSRALAKRW